MRFIILALLIAFPLAELFLLAKLVSHYGFLWVLFYVVVVAMLGLQLIKEEKQLFSGRFKQQMLQGGSPFKAMFGSARNIFAGILLLVPGVITDVFAVILLLIPVKSSPASKTNYQETHYESYERTTFGQSQSEGKSTSKTDKEYDIIEGEYRREE